MTDLTETPAGFLDLTRKPCPARVLPDGDDLALSRATDFFDIGAHLDERERAVLARVREYCDTQVAPVVNDYWERAEFPPSLVAGYRELGVAGGTLAGHGCPGLSPVAEGLVAAELARGDGSIATFNAVHSGLAMTAIGLLGSEEQKARWLPAMAAVDRLGAFALTEPEARQRRRAAADPRPAASRRQLDTARAQALDRQRHRRRPRRRLGPRRRRRRRRVRRRTPGRRGEAGARLPRAADHRQGREPRGVAGADRAQRRARGRGRAPGRAHGRSTTPTRCWRSRARRWRGRRWATPSRHTRPR